MEFRYLGNSGLKISEITYGNWVTHGSQVDDSAAIATVHAAQDAGITTFDTADTYGDGLGEEGGGGDGEEHGQSRRKLLLDTVPPQKFHGGDVSEL